MSVSATVSTLGQMLDNSARLRDIRTQLSTLQTQLSTQKKAQDMSGLGGNGTRAVRARIDLNQISVFQSNIAIGTAQLDSTSNTLNEFVQQSKNIADTLAGKTQNGNVDITDVRASVQHTFDYLRELLNTQSDGKYIMAGSDSYNAPLNDAGPHNTYMAKLVEDWRTGVIDTDTLITNYQATPETTMGYSASLSSNQVKNVYVRADVNHDVDITLAADSDGFKKILNGLALINNMNIDKVATDPNDPPGTTTAPGVDAAQQKDNFFDMYENVIKQINTGINELRSQEERLQRAKLTLQTVDQNHTTDSKSLQDVVGQIESVDTAEVAVRLNALQTQLESAYQATALIGSLSLSRYL